MPGGRLTWQDRQQIAAGLAEGQPSAEIAKRLGRPTSTITREVLRNGGVDGYRAGEAQQATARRARRGAAQRPAGHRAGTSRHTFQTRLAAMMERTGVPRTPAKVLSCLITNETGGMTAAELVDRLRISPASVSKAVNYLAKLDMVRRERDTGRRERYLFDDNVWYRAMDTQLQICELWAQAGREGAEHFGADSKAGARLHEMSQFFTFVGRDMATAAAHWRDVFAR